jgi:hypothetical protein
MNNRLHDQQVSRIPKGSPGVESARRLQRWRMVLSSIHGLNFFGGSSFNDGTTQTALDPRGRGPVRTH